MNGVRWFVSLFLLAGILTGGFAAPRNVISDWDDTASTIIVTNAKKGPGSACVYLAYVTVAMYDAVMAVDRRFRPFAVSLSAPAGASPEAAAVAAAHDVLVRYFPAQQPALDAAEVSSLAAIADGLGKADGAAAGSSVAAKWVAMRADDGLEATVAYAPGHGPGVWEPVPNVPAPAPNVTPAPVEPWFQTFRPFALSRPDQFFSVLEKPYALDSAEWAADFNLTKSLGALKSTVRTSQQTEIGLFWTDHGAAQYMRAVRDLIESRHLGTADAARLSAMSFVTLADAFAASMSAKYRFGFWRPYTAIRNAADGTDPEPVADAAWVPLAPTPGHPEYPANHGVVTAALMDTLTAFFGTDNVTFTVTSNVTHTTHVFQRFSDVVQEVNGARIYGGMHFRHSLLQGNILGRKVADYICRNNFLPAT